MDEGVFDAEATLEQERRREVAHTQDAGTSSGQGITLLATGGVASSIAADEETPLLSRDARHKRQNLEDTVDQEHERPDSSNEWPGQADFDGLPWWRQPSVCATQYPCLRMLTSI